jgi:hypothetical protein
LSLVLTTTRAAHSVSQQRDATGKANILWCGNVSVTLALGCIEGDLGPFDSPWRAEVFFMGSSLEHFQTNKQSNERTE